MNIRLVIPLVIFFISLGSLQAQTATNIAEALYVDKIDKQITQLRESLPEDKHAAYDQLAASSKNTLINALLVALSNEFTGSEQAEITNFCNTAAGTKLKASMVAVVPNCSVLMQDWEMALEESAFGL